MGSGKARKIAAQAVSMAPGPVIDPFVAPAGPGLSGPGRRVGTGLRGQHRQIRPGAASTRVSFLLAASLLAVLSACSVTEPLQVDDMAFVPSETGREVFFEQYAAYNLMPRAVSGRASVQVSEPGHTERANVRFRSDRHQSLLLISNNLGIEGGRIYSNPDSVIVYNRIEEVAHKMSHDDAAWFYLNGIGAMNLIRMLYPLTGPEQIEAIFESDEYYLVETGLGERHLVSRDRFVLRRTERNAAHPEAYSTFQFDNHADLEGYRMPRRIQILSYDGKSNIFLIIRALELNPTDLEFDPGIPDAIDIIRL